MNFNRIFVISFLVLVISTYQTDSGIIFTLLLKVLLLKGALFLSMPLSVGAFMMGQGMGFFAGNMMGGYMMLRAANRYHTKEKATWTGGGSDYTLPYKTNYNYNKGWGAPTTVRYPHSKGWGWQPPTPFHKAYSKGKSVGKAINAINSHKIKLASAIHKVKGILGQHKSHGGWEHPPPPPKYGPPKGKGWGWGKIPKGYTKVHDYHYSAHSQPEAAVTTKYKLIPYTNLESAGVSSSDPYGVEHQDTYGTSDGNDPETYGAPSGVETYGSDTYGSASGDDTLNSEVGEILKGQLTYTNFYPPTSTVDDSYGSGQPQASSYPQIKQQDPSNTFYTSAYGGPGHEYTGILTNNQGVSQIAQDKSSEESIYIKDDEDIFVPTPTSGSDSIVDTTVSPNPLLEKYLEKRLEEEASKQADVEQQEETQQLIQLLRKAYLKQLVESLKEEEKMSSSTSASSENNIRGSRSIENEDRHNLIREILFRKIPTESKELFDMESSDSVPLEVVDPTTAYNISSDANNNVTYSTTTESHSTTLKPTESTTTTKAIIDETTKKIEETTKVAVENETNSETERTIPPRLIMKVIPNEDYVTTWKPDTTINELEESTEKSPSDDLEKVTHSFQTLSSDEKFILLSSTEKYNIIPSTEHPDKPLSSTIETPEEESSTTPKSSQEFMPAMWVKAADNTFSDEAMPFTIRVKRQTHQFIRSSRKAQSEGGEVYDEEQPPEEAPQSQPQIGNPPQMNPDAEKQITAFVDDIKKFFTLLTVLDQDQCLQKLVCDVHTNQKDPATLTPYEQNILTTFRLMKALMPAEEEDSSTKYRRAALIGETGQSLELCQQTYSTCGFSSSQIITLGSQAEATPSDWTGAGIDGTAAASTRSEYVTMPRVRRSLRSFYL